MYQSYSYSNMPKPVNTFKTPPGAKQAEQRGQKPPPHVQPQHVPQHSQQRHDPPQQRPKRSHPMQPERRESRLPFLGRLQSDDMILLVIIAILLMDDCDDKLLLLALAYIFFSDYFENGGTGDSAGCAK